MNRTVTEWEDSLDALATRVEQLEATIVQLRIQLDAASNGRFASMRDTRRCPACGGNALLHFKRLFEKGDENVNFLLTLFTQQVATLEAYACRACKLVEWHATSLVRVPVDGEHIVAIDPEDAPKDGPFR